MKKWPVAKWKKLQQEFDSLTSYSEKLKYWIDKKLYELDMDFIPKAYYFKGATETIQNSPRIHIMPKNEDENFLFNSYILENFHIYFPEFEAIQTLSKKFEFKLFRAKFPQKLFAEEVQTITNLLDTEIQDPNLMEIIAYADDDYANYFGINKGYDLEAKGKTDEYITKNNFFKVADIFGVFRGIHIARYHRYLIDKAAELLIDIPIPDNSLNLNQFKLTWKQDSKILINLFYNLKTKGYIANTTDEISEFLINNFQCFSHTKKSTIMGQFSNKKAPKRGAVDFNTLIKEE